jgi:hypothetical protein
VSAASYLKTVTSVEVYALTEFSVYCRIITLSRRVYAENATTGKGKPGIEFCFQNLPRTLVPT